MNEDKALEKAATKMFIRQIQHAAKKGGERRSAARTLLLDHLDRVTWWSDRSSAFRQEVLEVALAGSINDESSIRQAPPHERVEMAQVSLERAKSSATLFRRITAVAAFIVFTLIATPIGGLFFAALSYIPTGVLSHVWLERFKCKSKEFLDVAEYVKQMFHVFFHDVAAIDTKWEKMSWNDLEFEVATLLRSHGYDAWVTPATGDGGVDVEAARDGTRLLVQCKKYNKQVGPSAVRELFGVVSMRPGSKGLLVAPSGFSRNAREVARECSIDLWDLQILREKSLQNRAIKRRGLGACGGTLADEWRR